MKKKVLAMLLGGAMAVGGLSMSAPATAEAMTQEECGWHTASHVESYEVTVVDGELTVTIEVNEFEGDVTQEQAGFSLFAVEKQLPSPTDWFTVEDALWEMDYAEEACLYGNTSSGTYTFTGLTAGKTYYVYVYCFDHVWGPESVDEHDLICLGSGTPTVGPANTPSENTPSEGNKPSDNVPSGAAPSGGTPSDPAKTAEAAIVSRIKSAEAGSTVTLDKGTTTLSNAVMKELLKKGDVSLKLEYTYNDQDYVVVIPAGAALDNDIPWYGPLYLAQQYGNSAGTGAAATVPGAGTSYEVKSGDRLGKIAAANNMTLKQLLEKNPQIKDANKIKVGQKINL